MPDFRTAIQPHHCAGPAHSRPESKRGEYSLHNSDNRVWDLPHLPLVLHDVRLVEEEGPFHL